MSMLRTTLACLIVALVAASAAGDVVHLKNGRTLEGTVVERGDRIEIRTAHGSLYLSRDEVVRIEEKDTVEDVYRARRAKIANDDVEARFRLALWLRDEGHDKLARTELTEILELSPDHRGVHQSLGHVRFEGKWMTEEQALRSQGYVRHEGRWITAEEKALLERDQAYRARVVALQRRVDRLVRAMASPRPTVRARYHRDLVTLARKIQSPELEKAAHEVKAWYDDAYRILAQQARVTMEVRAQMASLKRPIPTLTTSLGAGSSPVTIQLPEVALVSIGTTVTVPAGR
jgi:hypothetical protein